MVVRCISLTLAAGLASLALSTSAPGLAQEVADLDLRVAAAQAAERRGAELYAYDQAAWHATDRFVADAGGGDPAAIAARFPGAAGYVVVPTDDPAVLETLFVARRAGALIAVDSYRTRGDQVIAGGLLTGDEQHPLSPIAAAMFTARDTLLRQAEADHAMLCTDSAPNTLVLPPDAAGTISAYLLSSATDADSYPLGGHYRMDLPADGAPGPLRPLARSCLAARWDRSQPDWEMSAFFVTSLLTDHPSEIHAFVSHYAPVPLGVITNDAVWLVVGGAVAEPVAFDEDQQLPE